MAALETRDPYSPSLCPTDPHARTPSWNNECLASFAVELPYLIRESDPEAHRYLFGPPCLFGSQGFIFFIQSTLDKYVDAFPGDFLDMGLCQRPSQHLADS